MHIVILEPFFTGSHAQWAQGYARHSQHRVDLLTLPGRHWKWRMHGGAISLARQLISKNLRPDLILASDMIDLSTFLALTRDRIPGCKCVLYFHENQLTYPWSPADRDPSLQRDMHYAFINYSSALAADQILFNSQYHRSCFLSALPEFLNAFPDFQECDLIQRLQEKSSVLPLGLDLLRFCDHETAKDVNDPPLILWNHRWEFDKNPEDFFSLIFYLANEGIDFQLAVLGENFAKTPAIFKEAHQRLGSRIVQFGYASSFADYAHWLWRADLLPVTSHHDFFGISVVEALFCNCYPLLPHRQAYPEHLPPDKYPQYFYADNDELRHKAKNLLLHPNTLTTAPGANLVRRYDWQQQAPRYDQAFQNILQLNGHSLL